MTKEEALEELDTLFIPRDGEQDRLADALEMAIEALKQEPCTDAVSRKAAINACLKGLNRKEMVANIKALPSVTPAQKIGRWIMHIDDLFPVESTMECSECGEHQPITIDDNFCPNCGAKMQEVDE